MTSIISQEKRLFNKSNSNGIISKSENICLIFFCIGGIFIKFGILWNKNEPQRLFVFDIMDGKKRSYLNAQKASCQNTYI